MLMVSRFLLGMGEGGGFPAATRAVAEWFPAKERATAMGIINAGTAVGAVIAPPLIAGVLIFANWRWVFVVTGALGLIWTLWCKLAYFPPREHPKVTADELAKIHEPTAAGVTRKIPWHELLRIREAWVLITAQFLSDAAWYFYLFWL